MTEERGFAGSVILDGQWWISGGYNDDRKFLTTTERLSREKDKFSSYKELPLFSGYHTVIALNASTTFVVGGRRRDRSNYFFDTKMETWSDGPPLPVSKENYQVSISKSNMF